MWTCPNCETLNDGEVCVICNTPKTAYVPPPPPPPRREKIQYTDDIPGGDTYKKGMPTAIKAFLLVAVMLFVGVLAIVSVLELVYQKAGREFENGNYDGAKAIYNNIRLYRDSLSNIEDCDYEKAQEFMEQKRWDEAREILGGIGGYGDEPDELIVECDYQEAIEFMEYGEYISAYDLFESLNYYKDSDSKLDELIQLMYYDAVASYQNGNYDCREYFLYTSGYGYSDEYLQLIDAREGNIDDVTDLYNLLDFEDTDEVIESNNEYLTAFLVGEWRTYDDSVFIKLYDEGRTLECSSELLEASGKQKIDAGCQYVGSTVNSMSVQWKYDIVSEDKIYIDSNVTGNTYVLYRE